MKKISHNVRIERAARLKSIRKNQGYTIEQFAEKLKISKEGYQKIESGENNLSLDMLQKCKEKMNISADYLLYGEPKEKDEVWMFILNCSEETKMEFMLRLYKYFTYEKPPVYPDAETDLNKLLQSWSESMKEA